MKKTKSNEKIKFILHKALLRFINFPGYCFLRLKVNYHRRRPGKIQEPFIIISNHNTDLDPVLVLSAFRQHAYAVASEHIFRKGFSSWLLKKALNPIARPKGTSATGTVIELLKRLKTGQNILLFAEGNKSYSGLTNPITASTGKLIKKGGCTLVTFRLNGGYFTSPRWAKTPIRRGRIDGGVVNVYSPDQIAGMSSEEITQHISDDIFEDAYAIQDVQKIRYKGKNLAEGIETALFLCPKCNALATISSHGNTFTCSCGMKGEYTEYGYLEGNHGFTTIRDWDQWQINKLKQRLIPGDDRILFSENSLELHRILKGHGSEFVDSGTLSVSGKGLSIGNTFFALDEIDDVSVHGSSALIMTVKNKGYYEIPSDRIKYHGRVFLLCIENLKQLALNSVSES